MRRGLDPEGGYAETLMLILLAPLLIGTMVFAMITLQSAAESHVQHACIMDITTHACAK